MAAAYKERVRGRDAYLADVEGWRRRVEQLRAAGTDKAAGVSRTGTVPAPTIGRWCTRRARWCCTSCASCWATTPFWAAVRAYTQRHAGQPVTSTDLQRAFEASSGRDLQRASSASGCTPMSQARTLAALTRCADAILADRAAVRRCVSSCCASSAACRRTSPAASSEAVGFQQGPDGTYYVFDRRAHAVFAVNDARTAVRTLVGIGQEEGRLIQPKGFDVADDGRIVVADAPRNRHRIQVFDAAGVRQAGFYLPGQPAAQVVVDNLMLNGTGAVHWAGARLLLSHPESGVLVTAYSPAGYPTLTFGRLRATGFETRPRTAPCAQRRAAAGRSHGRLLLRVPHRHGRSSASTTPTARSSSSATSRALKSTRCWTLSPPCGRGAAWTIARCRSWRRSSAPPR